jgi:hypothetical protein
VPRCIRQDELAPGGCEIPVRDVYRDALFPLGAQAISEQREVDGPGVAVFRCLGDRRDLIFVNRLRIVEEPADQRALPIVDAAGGADAEKARFLQK